MDGYVVSTERVIPAPAEVIFDLVADPARHPDIDGSGTVKQAKSDGGRLALGDTFGMSMHMGIGYSMFNTVTEFEVDAVDPQACVANASRFDTATFERNILAEVDAAIAAQSRARRPDPQQLATRRLLRRAARDG